MANKEIHYMSDNGTMFWPATTTTAIIDPTSREILSDILNKKVSVGIAGNISSTVLPPIILESIATASTDLTVNATLIGKTYFCPDLDKIRHFYALEVNQSFQTTPEDTDPSPEITYYDKETDKFYRWDAVNQEMIGVVTGGDNNIQEITWSALKTLRDGGNLTPGQLYRITDYTCTTTQTDTQSAGHVFDIIVLALSESTLSEKAWADHHEGDTYFTNCKLEAWELKYCLDNNTERFSWADTTNGKGVIYWMRDEWNNECPYDFKNIQFKRWEIGTITTTSNSQVSSSLFDKIISNFEVGNDYIVECSYTPSSFSRTGLSFDISNNGRFFYTFQGIYLENNVYNYYDLSSHPYEADQEMIEWFIEDGTSLNLQDICRENIIKEKIYRDNENCRYPKKLELNNIVFIGFVKVDSYQDNYQATCECRDNLLESDCSDMTIFFQHVCCDNVFEENSYENLIAGWEYCGNKTGIEFQRNILIYSNNNTFGNTCYNNILGNYCNKNKFGNLFYNNILGNSCNGNIFGNSCQQNVFGDSCAYNISGNVCTGITLGTGCNSNIFGNYCTNITALKNNNNSYNIFENNIANISLLGNNPVTTINNCTIEQNCRSIIFGASSFKNGTVESGNSYINLIKGISGNGSIQNFRICSGIAGTSSLYKNIIFNIVDNSYLITYKPANSVEISI